MKKLLIILLLCPLVGHLQTSCDTSMQKSFLSLGNKNYNVKLVDKTKWYEVKLPLLYAACNINFNQNIVIASVSGYYHIDIDYSRKTFNDNLIKFRITVNSQPDGYGQMRCIEAGDTIKVWMQCSSLNAYTQLSWINFTMIKQ